jgi:hypothetical protein
MSDNIVDLANKFKEKTKNELSQYAEQQYKTIVLANQKIQELQAEVEHLKQLLTSTVSIVQDSGIEKIIKSPELSIIETQIEILQNRALQKELTLEEVKVFDLLIKNKRLLSEEATTIHGEKKIKKNYSEAELVQIASQPKKLYE